VTEQPDNASHCFVCGPENPIGLHLIFRLENNICRAEFTPQPQHCGYTGITHGGIIFSVLDDVMANWLVLQGKRAYTAKVDLRYKDSLPTGTPVRLEGHCQGQPVGEQLITCPACVMHGVDDSPILEQIDLTNTRRAKYLASYHSTSAVDHPLARLRAIGGDFK